MPVDIATVTLRANPAYRLEPWERLEPQPGVVLPSSGGRGHPYGVLLPRSDSALPPRAVLSDVALAFLALREPGRLPAGTFGGPPGDASRTTLGLLMDGVLEAEWNGRFVSGPQACEELGLADHGTEAAGRLARLSRRALRYGAALGIVDPLQLASRLYCYNRQPAGPATARVRGAADSLGFLGLDETSAARRALERHWRLGVADEGWLTFSTRRSAPAAAQPAVKLYVSPLAETLPGILGTLQRTLARCRAVQFKVGVGAAGLNRPDKAVAYFLHREDLLAAADGLRQELDGAPAHGVPFSGELGGTACSPGESTPPLPRARGAAAGASG